VHLVFERDRRCVSSDADDAGEAVSRRNSNIGKVRASQMDLPGIVAFDVLPKDASQRDAIAHALKGAVGIVRCGPFGDGVRVEVLTAMIVEAIDAIDAAAGGREGRTIVPLCRLSDDSLAALAAASLQHPPMRGDRIIEWHLERLRAEDKP